MENNIGKLNAIFLQNAENLFKRKNGVELIKEYYSIILKNRGLLKEFMVYDYIENVEHSDDIKEHINESINYLNGINKKSLKESNEILAKFFEDNKIEQKEEIKDFKLYEAIDSMIFTKKNLKTINERVEKLNVISEYIKENKQPIVKSDEIEEIELTENSDAFFKFTIEKFNRKYSESLTEEEKEIFKAITSPLNEEDMSKAFNEQIKECLTLTNSFLKESIDNTTKEKLLDVKEKLLEQKFEKESYFSDMLSFVELKQTLSE